MDQVRSRTRMVHLPPKDKEEDEAHLERWKHMMEESRLSGESAELEQSTRSSADKKTIAELTAIQKANAKKPSLAVEPRGKNI